MSKNPIERLMKTNPDLEVWWDSSPVVFESWVQMMIEKALPEDKEKLEMQLRKLYNAEAPEKSLFRGCTTNPPLSWQAVQSDPDLWGAYVDQLISKNPDLDNQEIAWLTYKEVVSRGAKYYMPIYESSRRRFGWISAQLNPRLFTETEQMVRDADELKAISPNVMIKVPASTEGVEVVKILTSKGISTNTTTCFTLPQIKAVADAAMEGIEIAKKNGKDMSNWRAVITMMIGRLTENPVLDQQAERRGIHLTWQEKHWWGIGVFKRAYRMIKEGGYASKMLACSVRQGPLVAGKSRFWDIEFLAGGEIVYTLPPYALEPLFDTGDIRFHNRIEEEIPSAVWDKMMKIPYVIQASDPNGMEIDQFNTHPATVATVESFSKAFTGLEGFVQQRMNS
ncbi:MAG: transaldolase family protein [Brevefilum sp.]|nr:transaldolase family protein [Brevefilum sp.]